MAVEVWAELWTRPGSAVFGRVHDFIPANTAGLVDGLNRVGAGNLEIADSWVGFDDVLLSDPVTPANSVSSLVRVYSAKDPTVPIFEWLPNDLVPGSTKEDRTVQISGVGVKGILGYARLEPWDWDGSDDWAPAVPDWSYGGRNLLSNPFFSATTITAKIFQLTINGNGGTYTLSDGTDTTSAIAYNATASTIQTRLETDIASLIDVNVSTAGPGVHLIQMIDPPFGVNLTIDTSAITDPTWRLRIGATGGTYTISDGTDTTSAIAYDATPATIKTRLETDITAIVTVTVTDEPGYVGIEITNPAAGVLSLTLNTGSLTGGGPSELVGDPGSIITTVEGGRLPDPWTRTRSLISGVPQDQGFYTSWGLSSIQAHSGTLSLLIDPGPVQVTSNRLAGAQQVMTVIPGGIYQASIWIYPTSGTDTYRLGIFSLGDDVIAWTSGEGSTYTANQWNLISLPDVLIPDGVTQVIFRLAVTNAAPSNPAQFFLDDAEFNEGLPADTTGKILRDVYEDATINHAGRIVWEDEANPGTPYLTLDFDDALDSAGAAWADNEISIRLTMRMSYSQIMAEFAGSYGYEYRIIPDDPELGTWLWQVFNPGTLMTDYTTLQGPAIQGGSQDVTRSLRRFTPGATDSLVEGVARVTGRDRNTSLLAALGRIEGAVLNREANGLPAAGQAAAEAVATVLTAGASYSYVLVDPLDEPLSAYQLGDLLTIVDPPEVADVDSRFVSVTATITAQSVQWETQFGSTSIVNPDAAVADAVHGLLAKFEYPDELGGSELTLLEGGAGGVPRVVIAAANASELSQSKADYIVPGTNDGDTVALAVGDGTFDGEVRFTEGDFEMGTRVMSFPNHTYLTGAGMEATSLIVSDIDTIDWTFSTGGIRFLTIKEEVS